MRQMATYHISDIESFKRKLSSWAAHFEQSAVFQGNNSSEYGLYLKYDMLVGADSISEIYSEENSFSALSGFHNDKKDWLFGFLSYDLKNEIEEVKSENDDNLLFPLLHFFQPKWVFEIIQNEVKISFPKDIERKEMQLLFREITQIDFCTQKSKSAKIKSRISKEQYFEGFEKLKEHIYRGDIYEVNYCQEYYAENAELNPISVYQNLYDISKPPFAAFYRAKRIILCVQVQNVF